MIDTAAVAALNGLDPLHLLASGRTDFLIAERIAERADEIARDRKRAEIEALAKSIHL